MTPAQREGLLLLVAAAVGYAFFPMFAKWGYAAGLTPLTLLTWRFAAATPIIWLLIRVRGTRSSVAAPRLPVAALLVMGALFAGVASLAFISLSRIPASTYTVLLYAYPAFVALFSLLLGERLSGRAWFALALTLVGVLLTVPNADFTTSDPTGMLLALLNGATYAIYIVVSSRLLRDQSDFVGAGALSITGSLVALVIAAPFTGVVVPASSDAWAVIVGMALFSTVLPIVTFYAGLQRVGAPRAAILSTLEPVIVLVLSFVLLRETMQPIQLVGGAVILASAVLLQTGQGSRPDVHAAPPRPAAAASVPGE